MSNEINEGRDSLLEIFIFETCQLVEQLENLFVSVEDNNELSTEDINETFRIMHTIKGSSAMMGLNNISKLANKVEDIFYFIRENKSIKVNYSNIYDTLIKSVDFIKGEMDKIQAGENTDGDENDLVKELEKCLESIKKGESSTESIEIKDEKMYMVKVFFEEDCHMENMRAFNLLKKLEEVSRIISYKPSDITENNESSEVIIKNGFQVYFDTLLKSEEIGKLVEEVLFVKSYEIKEEKDMLDNSKSKGTSKKENITIKPNQKNSLVTVSVSKLDKLMDFVGEIVIAESMVIKNPELKNLQLDGFFKAARQLSKLTNELQDIVMSIRMIPVASIFQKMHRIVKDMCKKLNKDVELIIIGEDTEVDKNIIDNLSDPLMHLIRNAMDHGIETVDVREAKGKPPKGKLVLEAKNTGGDVIITISDDGKGLNKDIILEKAISKGLIKKIDEKLSDKEIFQLIFMPGLSTKEKVTEYSGRGVGLDVVKKNIGQVGGSISLDSMLGKGTTLTIRIPLTLAIVGGMQVKVGKGIYTIPTTSVRESFRVEAKDIILDGQGNEMLMLRGNCYPVIRLHQHFNEVTKIQDLCDGIVVMVESDDRVVCLFADRLIGEQQVVVKALPPYLIEYDIRSSGVGGCTILGDGSISLIIDVMTLINKYLS
ncbi:chemotaxis protein CheA [Clostridium cylindrosporum]|uniref:Chemotaxis protein CheA n=1 Tax=Clostridium cylindrosporum DSM 605 TaxID=1121307 RepID=A0A0J8D9M2_CLOCY|nr:chemotaxis protein CheA [Clostridium cylindrosporum]KMT21004.1 chemotaxis protein CheA [Clostridium cylindrosporum DSM 605]